MRDVAVTGMGVVSALGCEPAVFYRRLMSGEVAIRRLQAAGAPAEEGLWWAPVEPFSMPEWLDERLCDGTDLFARWALCAADQAVKNAGLESPDPLRTAVVHGTSMGGMRSLMRAQFDLDRAGPQAIHRKTMMKVWANMAAAQITMRYRLHGPSLTVATACASTLDALGLAGRLIESDQVDAAIVGGTEAGACLSENAQADGFVPALFYMPSLFGMMTSTPDARTASRPFDVRRNGVVSGEGSAFFVLERGVIARARGAHIHGYLRGYGSVADSHHPSTPDPSGQWEARAIDLAVRDAHVLPTMIDALIAHGTGTPKGDLAEIRAINQVHGQPGRALPVASIKGHIGHSAASSAGMSLIMGLLGMQERRFINTANTTEPEPEAAFRIVLHEPLAMPVSLLQINAFGFGGQNASIVVSAEPGQ